MNNVNKSYLLWMLVFLGFAGVHRLYNRKILTGALWLVTFGLFGIGQLIDLFMIPEMVDEYNARLMFRRFFHHSNSDRTTNSLVARQALQSTVEPALNSGLNDL